MANPGGKKKTQSAAVSAGLTVRLILTYGMASRELNALGAVAFRCSKPERERPCRMEFLRAGNRSAGGFLLRLSRGVLDSMPPDVRAPLNPNQMRH